MNLFIFVARVVVLSFSTALFFGCGAGYHLRKAKKHLAIAEAKGADISTDTVYKDILTKEVHHDTVLRDVSVEKLLRDTITVETVRYKTKWKYDTVTNTIYQKVEIKPEKLRVPVALETDISTGVSKENLIFWIILVCVLVLLFLVLRRKKKPPRN